MCVVQEEERNDFCFSLLLILPLSFCPDATLATYCNEVCHKLIKANTTSSFGRREDREKSEGRRLPVVDRRLVKSERNRKRQSVKAADAIIGLKSEGNQKD